MTIDRRRILWMATGVVLPAPDSEDPAARPDEVAALLRRQAQALADAIGSGDAAVWRKQLHDDCVYTNEDGEVLGKKALVEPIKPLPSGVSGAIRVTDFQARVHGGIAAATYVLDEHEEYHGHSLHGQYRVTDTWLKTPDGWRLLASQVLALRTDPPRIQLPAARLGEYCGRYTLAPEISYEIRRKGDGLEGQRSGRPATELDVEAPDVLFVPGRPRYRYVFRRSADGKITGFAERREAWDLLWEKSA